MTIVHQSTQINSTELLSIKKRSIDNYVGTIILNYEKDFCDAKTQDFNDQVRE